MAASSSSAVAGVAASVATGVDTSTATAGVAEAVVIATAARLPTAVPALEANHPAPTLACC
eukprot:6751202-Karenia_brevis.AAC.1